MPVGKKLTEIKEVPGIKTVPEVKTVSEVRTAIKVKRNFRSTDERLAEVVRKIAFHYKALEVLEKRKTKLTTARAHRLTYAAVFAQLKSTGRTPEEIAELIKAIH